MRLSLTSLLVAALAGHALAAPIAAAAKRGVLSTLGVVSTGTVGVVGGSVQDLTGLDTQELESALRIMLGSSIYRLEYVLHRTLAATMLGLVADGFPPMTTTAVAHALRMLKEGYTLDQANEYLSNATGGMESSIEDILGVQDIVSILF